MKILKIELTNFKGCKSAEYDFGNKTNVYGMNGTGKTTIADAILWVFADKNYANEKFGAKVRNVLEEALNPVVKIWFEHNNIEYDVEKSQKLTVKNRNGIESKKTENYYKWKGIEINQKTFFKHVEEIGIDLENFTMLVNPIDFLNRKQADVRKVIMSMAGSFLDIDIALKLGTAPDVASLLDSRTLEEIEATAKGTITKLKSNFGKNGEIIDAKIESLLESKTDNLDRAKIEQEKEQIETEIAKIQTESSLSITKTANKNAIERVLKELKEKYLNQLNIIFTTTNSVYNAKVAELKTIKNTYLNAENNIRNRNNEKDYSVKKIAEIEAKIKELEAKEIEVDEKCPTCGQELPKVDVLHTKQRLEQQKVAEIGKLNELIKSEQNRIQGIEKTISDNQVILDESNVEIKEKELELTNTPHFNSTNEIVFTDYPELVSLVEEIKKKEAEIKDDSDGSDKFSAMSNRLAILENELKHLESQLTLIKNNESIDKRIEDYKQEKVEMVNQKLYNEKLLHQINLINRAKNEIVVDEINNRFKKVKWKLFDYLMNGDYKEICEPMIDDKPLFSSVNTGLRIEAEIDILDGLQNFYEQNLPIIIDNAECLDSNSKEKLTTNRQLILLNVSNIDKELRVEGE